MVDGVGERERELDGETVFDGVVEGVPEFDGVVDFDGEFDGESVPLVVAVPVLDKEDPADGVCVTDGVFDGVRDGDAERVPDIVLENDEVYEGVTVTD